MRRDHFFTVRFLLQVITPAVGVGGNVAVVGGLFLCIQIYSFTANLHFSLSFFHLN